MRCGDRQPAPPRDAPSARASSLPTGYRAHWQAGHLANPWGDAGTLGADLGLTAPMDDVAASTPAAEAFCGFERPLRKPLGTHALTERRRVAARPPRRCRKRAELPSHNTTRGGLGTTPAGPLGVGVGRRTERTARTRARTRAAGGAAAAAAARRGTGMHSAARAGRRALAGQGEAGVVGRPAGMLGAMKVLEMMAWWWCCPGGWLLCSIGLAGALVRRRWPGSAGAALRCEE